MISVLQACCTSNPQKNLAIWSKLVQKAASEGSQFLCLPEAFDFIGVPGQGDGLRLAEPLTGDLMSSYRQLAKENKVWLSLGGFHQKLSPPEDVKKFANVHCVINNEGDIVAQYRKIHMFDTLHDGGYLESKSTQQGNELVVVRNTPIGTVGLSVCFDLRFPAMFTRLREHGCDVILVPAAFMPTTGKAHWHTLLKARAIETQCYIAAAAQTGTHNDKRSSYGHSLIVDPWGKVLVDLNTDAETFGGANVDRGFMEKVRRDLPMMSRTTPNVSDLKLNLKN